MRLDMMTILTKARAAYPTPATRAKLDTTPSANAIIAAEFAATAQVAKKVADSLRQRLLPVQASLDKPENEATLQQASISAASSNSLKIDLAALRDVPLGTPIQEIDRAAEAFGLDANFMKTVAKIESRSQSKGAHGLLYRSLPAQQIRVQAIWIRRHPEPARQCDGCRPKIYRRGCAI